MKNTIFYSIVLKLYNYFRKPAAASDNFAELIQIPANDHTIILTEDAKSMIKQELNNKHKPVKLILTADKNSNLQTARWLAVQQRKELYRIDLSKLVSKYIGETEKNLDTVFNKAENKNLVLFFDEADALFGKRSEVKDSHDRYANIEINYLQKRIQESSATILINCVSPACLDWKPAGLERLHG